MLRYQKGMCIGTLLFGCQCEGIFFDLFMPLSTKGFIWNYVVIVTETRVQSTVRRPAPEVPGEWCLLKMWPGLAIQETD